MKQRFQVLDGLRGTAALLVVLYHILQSKFPAYADNPLRHAPLAVDFFFLLSGFVVGHAYDDRWPALTVRHFLRIRLVRLHPLVLLGVALGLLSYLFDPFAEPGQRASGLLLTVDVALGALLLPGPPLPYRHTETHPLNGPSWSLLQEYLANVLYALVGRRLGRRGLPVVVAAAAGLLVVGALRYGGLRAGWGWDSIRLAPVRMLFPFFAGLLLYRSGFRIRRRGAFGWLALLLLALFAAPAFQPPGYYEALCVIGVFPLVVATGAGHPGAGRLGAWCRFSGEVSYPLYLTHFPFVHVFTHWVARTQPSAGRFALAAGALVAFLLAFAWAALRCYDEPVRAWLSARARPRPPAPARRGA